MADEAPPPADAPRSTRARLVAAFAALLALCGAAVWFAPPGRDLLPPATPASAGAAPHVALSGLVMVRDPEPRIGRALGQSGRLLPGELLMLRARLTAPAFLALVAQQPGRAAEPIWPATAEQHAAGEFELDEGDTPLLLDEKLFAHGATLLLVACREPPAQDKLRTRAPLADPGALRALFPGCAEASLAIGLEAAAPR